MAVMSCLGAPSTSPAPTASSTPDPPASSSSSEHSVAIFSDELNHASIIDGARLAARAGCALHVYRHNDMEHLDALLSSTPPGVRKLVATDSLFSMDGDFADLRGLARLKRRCGLAAYAGPDADMGSCMPNRLCSPYLVPVLWHATHVTIWTYLFFASRDRRHGFLLAVDEAHATLVCGEHGGGAAEALGVAEQVR